MGFRLEITNLPEGQHPEILTQCGQRVPHVPEHGLHDAVKGMVRKRQRMF